MDAGTLTVGQLARGIEASLSSWFGGELWVEGEIDSLRRRSTGGHVFFRLLERGDEHHQATASIDVALFDAARRHVNMQLRDAGGVRMTDGMRVRIRGRLEYYAPQGRVQLRMSGIDPAFTLALALTERDRVLSVLAADGLLDRNSRVEMPVPPLHVGLATSDGSAAMADFLAELGASHFRWRVSVVHVPVQGRDADRLVAQAIERLASRRVDVIALVRGGGSRLDLSTFDSERLGRTVATSPVPVITGIGHEIDMSVADIVAHSSFKTPTACAAALVEMVRGTLDQTEATWSAIRAIAPGVAHRSDQLLRAHAARAARLTDRRLASTSRQTDARWSRVVADSRRIGRAAEVRSTGRADQLERRAHLTLARAESIMAVADARARAADPISLMQRGWSITRTADGDVLRDPSQVAPGDHLLTSLATGTVRSRVAPDERSGSVEPVEDG